MSMAKSRTRRGGRGVDEGTKRKRAPYKGPCEHGVKYRSQCKVQRLSARERRSECRRSAAGHQSASTVVYALSARSGGLESASTVVTLPVQGVRWGSSASTVVGALRARRRGGQFEHGRQRSQCKKCGGSGTAWSTVVCAIAAREAVGLESASTVVYANSKECGGLNLRAQSYTPHARSGGAQSASTVVYALSARSAVGHKSASTVVYALHARSAVGAQILRRREGLTIGRRRRAKVNPRL